MSDSGCNKKPSVNGRLIQTTATVTVAQIRSAASTHGRDRLGYIHRLPTEIVGSINTPRTNIGRDAPRQFGEMPSHLLD
jgi:hypothetical protein